jgi:hypothetical protein
MVAEEAMTRRSNLPPQSRPNNVPLRQAHLTLSQTPNPLLFFHLQQSLSMTNILDITSGARPVYPPAVYSRANARYATYQVPGMAAIPRLIRHADSLRSWTTGGRPDAGTGSWSYNGCQSQSTEAVESCTNTASAEYAEYPKEGSSRSSNVAFS